jgi:perosamine synthetase
MSSHYLVPYSQRGSDYGLEEFDAIRGVLSSPDTLSCGSERDLFEHEFATYLTCRNAVTVSSCTTGLDLVLRLLNLKSGENVISTPQTYQSTVHSLIASPVEVRFADIEEDTLCMSAESLTRCIDEKTRAVIVTHYGGIPADMDAIMKCAEAYNAFVLEDCAHAHGALYKGRHPGVLGHAGVYSFQSMKNMSTLGQGGMVTTNDDSLATRLRRTRAVEPDALFVRRERLTIGDYSPDPPTLNTHAKNAFFEDCVWLGSGGSNATLSEPAAAVGRVQLRRLPSFVARRRWLKNQLDFALADFAEITLQPEPANIVGANHLYTCFLAPDSRFSNRELCAALDRLGIEIQLRNFPLHLLPEWRQRGGRYGQCPTAETLWFNRQINLPIYPAMGEKEVRHIREAMAKALANI